LFKKLGRPSTTISKEDQSALIAEVEKVFGRSVNQYADCIALEAWLAEQTSHHISSQTLRRFFGLVSSDSTPSLFTLNALCVACGFIDWNHFREKSRQKKHPDVNSPDSSLIAQCEVIESFFKIETTEWKDNNFFKAIRQITKRVHDNPILADMLWNKLAKLPTAQQWLFEYSSDMSGLAGYYRQGIAAYLRNKKTHEAQVFGHCLLFLGDYLSENRTSLETQFKKINAFPLNREIHCLPLARQLGTHLLYSTIHENYSNQQKWLQLSMGEYLAKHSWQATNPTQFPGYHFMLADYLLLGNYHIEAYELLENYMPVLRSIKPDHAGFDHVEAMYLMYATASTFIGKAQLAKTLVQKIQPERISIIYRKYFMIRYLLLQLHLTNSTAKLKKSKLKAEIESLINDTGYTYFNHHLNKYF
jgi:hypothetical protein